MKKQANVNNIYNLFRVDIDGFDFLAELALDMRWSWNHYGDKLWSQLDAEL
jgi:starch phosphorylase